MDLGHHLALEPLSRSEALPTLVVEQRVGHFVGLLVAITRNVPEAYLQTKPRELVAESVELTEELFVGEVKAAAVTVAVVAPIDDPLGHASHQVSRVAFDDNFIDEAFILQLTVDGHVVDLPQSIDGRLKFGALTGRARVVRTGSIRPHHSSQCRCILDRDRIGPV